MGRETRGDTIKGEPSWRRPFLAALAATGIVRWACREAGISRGQAYRARDRHPRFRERWDDALDDAVDRLEAEARRRAVLGTERPIYFQGRRIDVVKEYSDTLLIFLLKAARPEKFRDNYDLSKLVDAMRR